LRLLLISFCLTAVLSRAGLAAEPSLEPEQLFERLSPSVWLIETFDARNQPVAKGSGVVIGPGSVVTNCHVLAKSRRVSVVRENVSYGATLEHADPERDLCQLKVTNFPAPSVTLASGDLPRIGARVYAIGSPRGLDQTLSDGLVSGIRRVDSDGFLAIQITVPISPGSSGGGLFDSRGRLIGITTFGLRDSQNLNFALPASWILEVPARAQAALAARQQVASQISAPQPGRVQVVEYSLRDRLTGQTRPVIYRLDRQDGDRLVYNQGQRVETRAGEVIALTSAIAGDFEQAMPPKGWVQQELAAGATWKLDYTTVFQQHRLQMDITANVLGDSTFRLKDREYRVVQIQYKGYNMRSLQQSGTDVYAATARASYLANAWYAPELKRVVRFEAKTRGGMSSAIFFVDELLELTDIRTE
jgi:hypothetical protein